MVSERIRYIDYFLKNVPAVLGWKLFRRQKNINRFRGQKGITLAYSAERLQKAIASGKPFAAVRFGAVELGALNNHEKIRLGFRKTYKDSVRYSMKNNAGFYPTGDAHLQEYGDLYEAKIGAADILAISGLHMEDYFAKKYLPHATIIQNWAMEPLLGGWTPLLKGKKVLIVSAFAEEIRFQYARREKIFLDDPGILPEFALLTLQAPMTMGEETDYRFPSFMRSLEEIEKQMASLDFDIALIGCGAYGTLLALYAKSLGKQAIQSGGATQTLFGILGRRWEKRDHVRKHVNESWIHPYSKPKGYEKIENGAYW